MQLTPSFQITLYGAEDCTNLPYKLTQYGLDSIFDRVYTHNLFNKDLAEIVKILE